MLGKCNFEELEIFLGGTFHQDIEGPDEALQEYISEVDICCLENLSKIIKDFLNAEMSDDEKNKFITNNTEIYFPAIGMSPIEWLKSVLDTLETKA